jgi:K+-sensing histidine kinase KdpD
MRVTARPHCSTSWWRREAWNVHRRRSSTGSSRLPISAGSGLGLSIAKDLVETHGGTITAANRPEMGAVVEVRLDGSGHAGATGSS